MALRPRSLLYPLLLLLLAACGGGGGGGGGGGIGGGSSSTASHTLSGSISLPDSAAVDSDTGDTLQAGWTGNNSLATAQQLGTPVQLAGYVNRPGMGASTAASFASGDINDFFQVTLAAGQTVILSIASDGILDDLDLTVYDGSSGALVGVSNGLTSSECVTVTRSASYYLRVSAYSGAALYSLRIGLPGENTACGNVATTHPLLASGEIIARLRDPAAQGVARARNAEARSERRARRMLVPSSEALQATGMQARSERWREPRDPQQARIARRAQRDYETVSYAKTLSAASDYAWVEPNYLMQLHGYTPNDPQYLPQRWHYEQINQPAAMERILALAPASQRPIVAVIDTGLVTDHPDFTGQQVPGMSFINGTASAGGEDPSTAANIANLGWHGTHVAGTVAALDNNNQFGAGVAHFAQVMPLRVFDPNNPLASSYDIIQAARYAAGLPNSSGSLPARRADVINLSLGGGSSCPAQYQEMVNLVRAQGVIVVAAAGNGARNDLGQPLAVSSPANCDGVIAVGALDAQRQRSWYSQSGSRLTLSAPGGNSKASTTGTGYPDVVFSTVGAFSGGSRIASFGGMQGTSMASPHVAGVMALMRYVHPGITPGEIDTLIASGKLTDDLGVPGRDDATGHGVINARKAVDEAALLAGGAGSSAGIIVAAPASIDFGSTLTSATLSLKLTAASSETVTALSADSAAVSITASAVDPATGLGDYTVSVNRNLLAVGTSYPRIMVTTSTRSFNVQLAVTRLSGGSNASASFGGLWVLALRASDWATLGATYVTPAGGKYQWSISGIPAGNVILLAGTDNNGDYYICDPGEACGSHPGPGQLITVTGNQGQLDFAIGLLGAGNSALSVPGSVAPGFARPR